MNATDILRKLVSESSMRPADVARALHVTPQAIDNKLNKGGDPRVSSVVDILDLLGYELVVTVKGAKLPSGAEVVTLDSTKRAVRGGVREREGSL